MALIGVRRALIRPTRSASQVSTTTTLDPAKKGTNLSLSGGNLTVTGTGLGVALSIAGHSTGKVYLEVHIVAGAAAIGIGNASMGLNSFLGAGDNDSIGFNSINQVFLNGAQITTGINFATGD